MICDNVTALIPVHRTEGNREWLEQAVGSLEAQCRVLVLENDGDVSGSFNEGLRSAQTEFVLPFGADDVAEDEMVRWLEGAAWDADVVYPTMTSMSEGLDVVLGNHPAEPFCGNRMRRHNFVSGASLIRREKALEVGGFRELDGLEDWDLWLRMLAVGARFKPCPEAKMLYRRRGGSRNDLTGEQFHELRDKIRPPFEAAQATFYAQATPATTYLRCQLPARYLPGVVRSDLDTVVSGEDDIEFPTHEGAAVFQFAGDKMRALTARLLQVRAGVRVLVEVDDNYLMDPGKVIREKQGWGLKIGQGPHTREGHRKIVESADGVIVTTDELAKHYRKVNPNVYVCPNTVDPVDWPAPAKLDDGVTRIGWLASYSHVPDIPLVSRALEAASAVKGVEVHTVGINPRWPWAFHHGWEHDLGAYRSRFQAFEIGVAPVKDTAYFRCRSDVKALEMGMGLVAPVLSDLPPYANWTHGENCLKARDAKEFKQHVLYLVRNPDVRASLALEARKYALSRTTEKMIDCWKEAVAG